MVKAQQRILPALTSSLVALAGLMSLAQVLVVHIRHYRFGRIDDSLLPFTAVQNSRLLMIGLGIFLLYLSMQVLRRKHAAFIMVSLGLIGLTIAELLGTRNVAQMAVYLLTLAALWITRDEYNVATNNLSLRRGAAAAVGIIAVVFVYATIGFSQLSVHEVGARLSLPSAAKYAAREIFTFQENQLPLESRYARWFVASVNGAATVAYALAVVSLFQPLRFQYGASRRERALAKRILSAHSASTEDYFKLWPPDKHYFFSETKDSFIAYKVVGRDALALGDPSGNPDTFSNLIRDFSAFARQSGWEISVIYASGDFDTWDGGEFQRIFIGNEAVISVGAFAETTHRSKHFRYIRNRAERDGLQFEYWHAPLTDEQLQSLRQISDAWLSRGSRREYTFALGYFDDAYIKNCDIAVLRQNGKTIAYANLLPAMVSAGRSIDHMRYTEAMPPTGMHYLLMQLILQLHEMGIQEFNLGLAPLSGLENRESESMPERLLVILKRLGSAYYSFGGLEQFKNKFEPDWQPRYLYYRGPATNLVRITRSLARALTLPATGRLWRGLIGGLSLVAALCYASFPLAYFTDPDKLFRGVVSQLGSGGQQYAGLFNGLSAVSGVLVLIIIGLLWARLRPGSGLPRLTLLFFGLNALGTILAAVTPLPRFSSHLTEEQLHDFFSVMNVAGTVGATWSLILMSRRRFWLYIMLGILVVSSVVFVTFYGHLVGAVAQRIEIITAALWTIIISVSLSRSPVPDKNTVAEDAGTKKVRALT